jgi:hypothetical protein
MVWLTPDMSSPEAPVGRSEDAGTLGFNLAALLMLAVMAGVGCAYGIDAYGRHLERERRAAGIGDIAQLTVAGRDLVVPAGMFWSGEMPASGFTAQIEIGFIADLGLEAPEQVRATLLPATRVRPSAALLDSVYLHQFADGTLSGAPGLVGKPVVRNAGQPGETVWYDPLSPNPFVARCQEAVIAGEAGSCLRTVILPSGLGAIYAFSETALAGWRQFDAEAERALDPINAWSKN